MAFKRRDKKHHQSSATRNIKRKLRKNTSSLSDHLLTNLFKYQFNSRLWTSFGEYINSFFPEISILVNNDIPTSSFDDQHVNATADSTSSGSDGQEVATSRTTMVFGFKSKLLIHGFSLWYDVISFFLSRERLVLDLEGHYTGTVRDYLSKVYKEYGLIACISNREVMGPIARFLVSTLYTVSIQMPILDSIREKVESPLARHAINRVDDILLMAANYPIETSCLMKFKRMETNKLTLIQSLKHIKNENGVVSGWYRGFGWSFIENILSETTSSLLSSGMSYLLCKLLDLDCGMNESSIPLTGDQLLLFKKLKRTTVDLIQDILLAPLRFSILRYRSDMSNQYTSPIDCFTKQVHSKQGFKSLYKGTWLGTFQ